MCVCIRKKENGSYIKLLTRSVNYPEEPNIVLQTQPISSELTKQTRWIKSTQVIGIICIFDFVVNISLNCSLKLSKQKKCKATAALVVINVIYLRLLLIAHTVDANRLVFSKYNV